MTLSKTMASPPSTFLKSGKIPPPLAAKVLAYLDNSAGDVTSLQVTADETFKLLRPDDKGRTSTKLFKKDEVATLLKPFSTIGNGVTRVVPKTGDANMRSRFEWVLAENDNRDRFMALDRSHVLSHTTLTEESRIRLEAMG